MPRVPYEVHRATRRAQSITPTETDYDQDGASLASYSTYSHVSSSSYRPSPSIHDDLRRRTLSSSSFSHGSEVTRPFLNPGSSRQSPVINWNDGTLAPARKASRERTEEEIQAKRERRAARRDMREAKKDAVRDTKRKTATKRESLLDKWVKWAVAQDQKGSRARGLVMSLGGVLLYRLVAELVISHMGITQDRISDSAIPTLVPTAKRFFALSPTHPYWAARALDLALEVALLWTGITTWTKMEGRRKGRSWKTQLTGIVTILLNPLITLTSTTLPLSNLNLGLYLWATVLLQQSKDILGTVCIALGIIGGHSMAAVPVGFGWFMLGKAIWLGGSRGTRLATAIAIPIISAYTLLLLGEDKDYTYRTVFEAVRRASWSRPSDILRRIQTGNLTKVYIAATIFTQLPTAGIILYSAISTRPTRSAHLVDDSFPLTPLLPIILLSSALPLHLLYGDPTITFPVLPISMLLALKGEAGDESWHLGVILSNLAAGLSLVPTSNLASAARLGGLYMWNYIIGYSPSSTPSLYLRIAGYITYLLPLARVSSQTTLVRSITPAISHSLLLVSDMATSADMWIAWFWALRKLVEEVWAMGGFTGRRETQISGVEVRITDVT